MTLKSLVRLLALLAVVSPVTARADDVYTSITTKVLAEPHPVAGADGRIHLAYEIELSNPGTRIVAIDKVEALGADGAVLETLEGDALGEVFQRYDGVEGLTIPPGSTVTIYMDATVAEGAGVPESIANRVSVRRLQPGENGGPPVLMPDVDGVPSTFTFVGAQSAVGAPAVVLAPPLRGPGWVAVNGCCASITSHRGGQQVINGVRYYPERFAIDFVRMDAERRLFVGDIGTLASYAYFGADVFAVAPGTVAWTQDGLPEQIAGNDAVGLTIGTFVGNAIVLDIGEGRFVLYAHLQPGSLRVKVGDRVEQGQVVALLGNTGNSNGPHLHFHVMDSVEPLKANGLPYVFTAFTGVGTIDPATAQDAFEKGTPFTVVADDTVGAQTNRLPLNNGVVDFAE